MALFNIFNISGSAMSAESLRLNTIASNLANSQSIGSSENSTYRAKSPIFSTTMKSMQGDKVSYGVEVKGIVDSKMPLETRYQPENPMADKDGYIYLPNVNVVDEMANMISASRAYQSNVEVLNTSKQLMMATLRLGQ